MSHTLTNYNGVQIVTPEDDLSADRQALNGNFEFLADVCVRNPMTGNVDGGGFGIGDLAGLSVGRSTPALYSLTDTGTGITVATGQGANGYNAISVPGGSYLSGSALMIGGSPRVLAAVVEVIGSGNGDIVGQLPNYYLPNYTGFALQTNGTGIYGFLWGETWGASGALSAGFNVVALVYDGTNAFLYLNGTSVGTPTFSPGGIDTASHPFCIGGQPAYAHGYGGALTGKIGDVVLLEGVPADLSGFLASLYARWFGADTFNPYAWGVPVTAWLNPNQGVTTDDSGNVIEWAALYSMSVDGPTNLDSGKITTNGSGLFFPLQTPTSSAPTYVKGGMYFDTTLNKLRIGGASGWETVTSS